MWVRDALFAMLAFTVIQLATKQLTRLGLGPAAILAVTSGCVTVIAGVSMEAAGEGLPKLPVLAAIAALSVLSYAGNFFLIRSIATAPNAGYPIAVTSAQVALVAVASAVLFQAELSPLKIVGVVLCLAGVVAVSL